ncbi:hypothetical protein FHS76_001081 [Ochrobactrum daejeonense]|uniref:Uncharacterized protein n=1 Tax=Brucella daejeonensis TaxID=659015 RepID=A0A7W9EKF9_9HYPH|nr:hypothetical protein [Brucella daejeonensis]MBB5701232.1 hypothetical protein [Brucella daejeonensis]
MNTYDRMAISFRIAPPALGEWRALTAVLTLRPLILKLRFATGAFFRGKDIDLLR